MSDGELLDGMDDAQKERMELSKKVDEATVNGLTLFSCIVYLVKILRNLETDPFRKLLYRDSMHEVSVPAALAYKDHRTITFVPACIVYGGYPETARYAHPSVAPAEMKLADGLTPKSRYAVIKTTAVSKSQVSGVVKEMVVRAIASGYVSTDHVEELEQYVERANHDETT